MNGVKMTLTKILIGDDKLGADESLKKNFELDYREIFKDRAELKYTADPEEFIQLAKTKEYDVLMIDLKWSDEDAIKEYKTGYRILEEVRDCAFKRILWTSESEEARQKGFQYGATHCISKRPAPYKLEEIIYGGN